MFHMSGGAARSLSPASRLCRLAPYLTRPSDHHGGRRSWQHHRVPEESSDDAPRDLRRLAEVAGVFLKLGALGFGGPAAHVAMMHQEVVERRAWVGEQEFADALGVTSVIPGPGSTQMA